MFLWFLATRTVKVLYSSKSFLRVLLELSLTS